ncbi:uncharacterized protein J8A68_005377 [[Candida] subhashii]|uniref:Zinc finger CHCC-type domain-containing protein n=1 Tax=[Candida] subhashii TaxID=561895 RepID=A0A8J5QF20_9ASCO|nr:uncharacterized protein J8A68_005377 [[Candida] subhashii]KAG7661108.1 hypothetical protein J8A68_005377 [[Candida] subhashii]
MLRITSKAITKPIVYTTSVRFNYTVANSVSRPEGKQLNKKDLQENAFARQAPNRDVTWSPNQESRIDVISKYPYRFVQHDLEQQPRPYAAIDLIAKEPVRYLSHHDGNIAVCDGNKGSTLQGHPKVFINLDQPKPATCGYCGLRYAKEEFKELIEGKENA